MALTVLLNGDDVTDAAAGLTYSSVDPGGFEACSFTLPAIFNQPTPGDPIRILEGLTVAWEGIVEDPGPQQTPGKASGQVQGVGLGVLLKDVPYQMIYVDRDQTRWGPPSVQRQIDLGVGWVFQSGSTESRPDATSGAPRLVLSLRELHSTARFLQEAWYDAQNVLISSVYYALDTTGNLPAPWVTKAIVSTDDLHSTTDTTAVLGNSATGTLGVTGARRHATVQLYYDDLLEASGDWQARWVLAVYGFHGLTKRGSAPEGFYAEDIATHALAQTTGIDRGVIEASGFVVSHSVYPDPTLPQKVIDDMATLLGWHWGVWEATSLLSTTPRLDFRARPSSATAVVSRADCDGLSITERRSQLYNQCAVTYADAAGTKGEAIVSAENPRMPAGTTRTLGPIDMGIGSLAAATSYATAALALAQSSQRGGGSPTLPSSVSLPGGGTKPAHLLKAGLDRLKITDLPDSGSWTDTDTRRFDTFRVKRVETSVEKGIAKTRAELDEGADLLEVLQARLGIAATLAG